MALKFVLSGYYGFKNFGDEAILSVLINKLQQNEKNVVTVISSNPDYTLGLYRNIQCVRTFDIRNIIRTIFTSDVLISGGGSLLQDTTSLKSLLYYLGIIFLALFFRKKVIIFAQGIGPINSAFGQFLTKIILKHCSYVSVRDDKSAKLLQDWGIKADLLCDPVFSVKVPITDKSNTLCIQLRNCKNMSQDFIDRLADAVSRNFSDTNIEIYSFQNSIDSEVCKNFENNLKMLKPDIKVKVFSDLTNDEIIDRISKANYLIAMRFHAIIIGLLTKTKTLAINYDIKVEKIAKEFDLALIDFKHDFSNEIANLKNQKPRDIVKNFDWSGIDNLINLS